MLYKSATLKDASQALDKILTPSLKSYSHIELIISNSHVQLVALMFNREPVDIAKRFLNYRLQKTRL